MCGSVNVLFYGNNCEMVYGDAAAVLGKIIEARRALGTKAAA
jgi:NAD(P) transhydrogenase subunit beta